jgi:cytidylate kinase
MAIVTISRGTQSGGKKLAEMLADKTGYRCVSREIIVKAAEDYGVPEGKLFEAIQKSPSIFQKLTFERERYLAYIQATLCEYAKDDELIYHGNAGHFLLEGVAHVLRIRLVADMPYRIHAATEQLHLGEQEAVKYIERIDKERHKWAHFLYDKDWRSPELYDIVFNLEHYDIDFVCEMVIHALDLPQFRVTPESADAMNNLLIASRLRAALAGIPKVRLDKLGVEAHGGDVVIRGKVRTQELMDAILEAAEHVPGVEVVQNQVQVDYRSYGVE